MQLLRVDTAGVRAMATRWVASVGELNATVAPAGIGLSCQASAAAVNAAHADIMAFTAALAARVGTRATHVAEADARYLANEAAVCQRAGRCGPSGDRRVAMATVAGIPSLSQLLAWPTEHLTDAADHWEAVGGRSYGVANEVWRDALSIDWQGKAADALRTATHSDMMTISAVADQLQAAAKVARSGASDLYAARSRVRYAVEDTHTAGFDVGEDLSVTDRSTGGSAAQRAGRQAQAQTFAVDIHQRAAQLVALDEQVAAKTAGGLAESAPPSRKPRHPAHRQRTTTSTRWTTTPSNKAHQLPYRRTRHG